ncbi:hypothetical protein [Flavobacterium sp.]
MKKITTLLICCAFAIFAGCSNSNDSNESCGEAAVLVGDLPFGNINTGNYQITAVALNEDCLDISISSSGCDGSNWETSLFSDDERQLKLELTNPEVCAAVVSKTMSFDMRPLRVSGQNQVTLNIEGWPTPVVYNY